VILQNLPFFILKFGIIRVPLRLEALTEKCNHVIRIRTELFCHLTRLFGCL